MSIAIEFLTIKDLYFAFLKFLACLNDKPLIVLAPEDQYFYQYLWYDGHDIQSVLGPILGHRGVFNHIFFNSNDNGQTIEEREGEFTLISLNGRAVKIIISKYASLTLIVLVGVDCTHSNFEEH